MYIYIQKRNIYKETYIQKNIYTKKISLDFDKKELFNFSN